MCYCKYIDCNNIVAAMDSVDNSIVPDLEFGKKLYVVEWFRRKSFEEWKGPSTFPINEAAEMGFYHIESDLYNDTVCCIHCDVVIFSWLLNDDIKIEHAKHSPNCQKGFNIPLKFIYLTQYIIDSLVMINFIRHVKFTRNDTLHPLYDKYAAFIQRSSRRKNKQVILSELVSLYSKDTLTFEDLSDDEKEDIEFMYNTIEDFALPDFFSLVVPRN